MAVLDYTALEGAHSSHDPFDFAVATGMIRPAHLGAVLADFPAITHSGLMPLSALKYGPAFAALIDELRSESFSSILSRKLGLDLSRRPLMITVRGRCHAKDGRIHTDSRDKVATALLYLNKPWESAGGRLRFLRRGDSLEDPVAEIPPDAGTLAAFRVCARSFHGHNPYIGVRRYVMLNWMANHAALWRELARHQLSAGIKSILSVFRNRDPLNTNETSQHSGCSQCDDHLRRFPRRRPF